MTNFPISYVDTHCHLDLYKTPLEIVKEAEKSSILVVGVTNTPSVFRFTENLSKQHRNIFPALGLHPELATKRIHELPLMWDYISQTRFIGEIGLDYTISDQSEREIQRDVFTQIVDQCGKYGNKVLTIHSRRSASDVISVIGDKFPGKIIMHWFSGTKNQAEKAVLNGYYFSFNSSMIRTEDGKSLSRIIPKNRILTETDGPFIKVNGTPVRPTHIISIVTSLARLYGLNIEEMKKQISDNYQALF